MSMGVHSFEIPHNIVSPVRDIVIIQIPYPPRKQGNIIMPDISRDLMQHNVMAGRIVRMGPIAFQYKDGSGISKHKVDDNGVLREVAPDDWMLIRPFAGTMITGGKIQTINSGYRYVSTFSDTIGVLPAGWLDASTLDWDGEDIPDATTPPLAEVPSQPRSRERIVTP